MSTALVNRAAAIRQALDGMGRDPIIANRYSVVAARWEELRLAMYQRRTTPGDDDRFRDLSRVLKALTDELWPREQPVEPTAECLAEFPDYVPGITSAQGFLPGPDRIICKSWQDAAGGWEGTS
jgi:hypothetical protein